MQTVQISLDEYNSLKESRQLLNDSELMLKLNKLVDLIIEEKFGLMLNDNTDDIAESVINSSYGEEDKIWDNV